jgi:hypothetical protein
MELQHIATTLQNTFAASNEARKAAEQQLEAFLDVAGYVVGLMKIMTATEVPLPIRQAASIQFKTLINSRWTAKSKKRALTAEEKTLVKQNIVELIVHVPPVVRSQVAVALRHVLEKEYPDNWSDLVPKVMSFVNTQDIPRLHGALYTMRIIIKKYEHKPSEGGLREPLNQIVQATFPTLLQLFGALAKHTNLEACLLQRILTKIFWSATQNALPPALRNPKAVEGWFTLFTELLLRPVPLEGQPEEISERKNYPPWKLKKWIVHIFNRFLARYGAKRKSDDPDTRAFSEAFRAGYAPKLLETLLQLLSGIPNGEFLPGRLVAVALNFMGHAIRHANTYQILKPHLPVFFSKIMFPLFCFNDADAELWENDPAELIRKESDLLEDFWDPRLTGMNVLLDLMQMRSADYLHLVVTHCVGVLNAYHACPENPRPEQLARQKDGALVVIGNLIGRFDKVPEYKKSLEGMITTHVIPEFTSAYPFLRARACWIFGECFGIEYENQATFLHGLEQVLRLTKDSDLPVRLKAAVSLRFLCQNELSYEPLKSVLPHLLEMYFALMGELENDDLVKSLEMIIQCFAQDIAPYAISLIQRLVENFVRLASAEEDDDAAAMAATECLGAIETILDSITKNPDLYQQVEPLLVPLLVRLLDDDAMEFMEETLKIMAYLTFYGHGISPAMWQLFPLLYKAFDGWATDWMDQIIIPLDNYISRGNDVFLSNPDYLKMVLAMYQKLIGDGGLGEIDSGEGAKLIEVVFQQCRGRIDEYVPGIIELAVKRLLSPETTKKSLKVLCLEVVANALWYNPALALKVLDTKGITGPVFQTWFELSDKFTRLKDKKLAIVGLSCIFEVPVGSLPASIQPVLGSVFMLLLKFIHLHEMQKNKVKPEKGEGEDGEDDDDDDDDDGLEDDDDDDDDDDDEDQFVPEDEDIGADADSLVQLSEAAGEYSFSAFKGDDDELVDGGIVTSPLDAVEPYVFFAQHMEALSQRDGQVYGKLMESLPGEQRVFYNAILQQAATTAQQHAALSSTH